MSKSVISIIGCGDLMLGSNYPSNATLPPKPEKLLLPVKHILTQSDLTFANLECVLLTELTTQPRTINKRFNFKSPDNYIDYIKDSGINLISIANNHINDFGIFGINNTVDILRKNNIHFAGSHKIEYDLFTKDHIIYGFCACSFSYNTVNMNKYDKIRDIISELKKTANIIIFSFHGGGEGKDYTHVTRKTEYYQKENRGNPYELARVAIDAGADIVFGHGPHVTRAIDLYKDRFIAYSLGNFATYRRFNLTGLNSIAPIIKVNVDNNGKFIDGQIFPIKQMGFGGPIIDTSNKAIIEIINLTKIDIPECELIISPNGYISKQPFEKRLGQNTTF
jgi:hypothetical protein